MGIASLQLNIFALTKHRAMKNREIMKIQDERELISQQMNFIMDNSETWYKDPEYKTFQKLDEQLDMEMETLETALEAIENNLKSIEEQKDNNVKDVPSLA